jgi:NADH:ubiquinone oxidoreductase subunit 6 (subunit J)
METLVWSTLVPLTVLSAVAAVFFENPVRCGLALAVCLTSGAGAIWAAGAPLLAAILVWGIGVGAGTLLLTTILLLNLTVEEVGRRRLSARRTVVLLLGGYGGTALLALVGSEAGPVPSPRAGALGSVLFDEHGVALALTFIALITAVAGALLLARRRA